MPPAEHLNLNVRGLGLSATVEINERSLQLIQAGRAVARLGLGQSPFPVPLPVVEALRANASRKEYLPVRGLAELRAAVADYHRRRAGIAASEDDVLIGPGSKELMFLLQLVYYGELVIPTPAWVSYAPQAQIIGRRVSLLACAKSNAWKLAPDDLQRLCGADPRRPRIVVLNYPSNPTGGTYTADELAAIAEVARRYGVLVLSDEIYGELHFRGEHASIARFYPEGTIVSSGLSKWCGAGGWRLGTFTFPRDLRWLLDAMAAVASETYTSTSSPIQYAAVRAFRGGLRIERYLWLARRILAALGATTARLLREAGADVLEPAGAFYLFPDFGHHAESFRRRGVETTPELCQRLLDEAGVAVLPGASFGREPDEWTLRMALVDFDGAKALAALETRPRDEPVSPAFLEAHCPAVLDGVRRLIRWVHSDADPAARAAPRAVPEGAS
jgi:aspartate aminotransferase